MKVMPFPTHIDEPKQYLLWSVDEIVPIATMLAVGVVVKQALVCFVIGLLLSRVYRRYKDSRPDGYLFHMLYWTGILPESVRTFPSPFRRFFIG